MAWITLAKFTQNDLLAVRAAVELRAEASEENNEKVDAKRWRRLLAKVENSIASGKRYFELIG